MAMTMNKLLAIHALALCGCGCVSEPQFRMLQDEMRSNEKALWCDRKLRDDRITLLERRVYHLERGELLDKPLKQPPTTFETPNIMLLNQTYPTR